jgi:hypothetical protein
MMLGLATGSTLQVFCFLAYYICSICSMFCQGGEPTFFRSVVGKALDTQKIAPASDNQERGLKKVS